MKRSWGKLYFAQIFFLCMTQFAQQEIFFAPHKNNFGQTIFWPIFFLGAKTVWPKISFLCPHTKENNLGQTIFWPKFSSWAKKTKFAQQELFFIYTNRIWANYFLPHELSCLPSPIHSSFLPRTLD